MTQQQEFLLKQLLVIRILKILKIQIDVYLHLINVLYHFYKNSYKYYTIVKI